MGAQTSTSREPTTTKQDVVKTVQMAATEDKILFDKILSKSRELYQKNKENFLDENFCKRISLTYTKKLYELPIQQVKSIHDKLETSDVHLELNTKVDNLNEEKFLVNELSGRLIDNFKNQKIKPGMQSGIQVTYPDIAYIQNRTLELLGQINNIEKNKIVGGRRRNNNNNNNNNDNNNNNNNNNNDNNNNNNNINNYNDDEEEENNREDVGEFNFDRKLRENRGKKDFRRDEQFGKKDFRRDEQFGKKDFKKNFNKGKFESVLGEQQNVEYSSNVLRNAKKELNNILKPANQVVEKVVEKPVNLEGKKNVEVNVKNNVKNNVEKKNYKSVKEIGEEGEKYCLDNKPCQLTKKEMCEKIVYHFIVRNNLIAAILSTIPFPDRDGVYKGSFPYERLKSLEKGEFCLPPYEEIKYKNEKIPDEAARMAYENNRIGKILKYINIMGEKDCLANGGRFMILKKEQMEELYKDDGLGRKYFDFAMKINNFYQNALITLYDILDNLSNNIQISTQNLNEISEATKKVIDELYLKTQFNYLLAVMVILEFKFEKNSGETEIKNNRLKKIISEDFTV